MTAAAKPHLSPAPIAGSPLARWDSRWKLAAIAVLVAGTAAARGPLTAAGFLAAAAVLAGLGRVPLRAAVGRAGLVLFAVAPVFAVVPFTVDPAGPGWDVGPLRVSESGLATAAGVGCRAVAIGTFALVLVRTAPLPQTLAAAHALRVPGVIVQVAQLAVRYTKLLGAEARRTRVALLTRGFRPRTDAHTYRTMGHALGGLLVRGGDRAERVAAAMRCRGFDGTFRTPTAFRTTPADVLGFAAAAGVVAGLLVADRLLVAPG